MLVFLVGGRYFVRGLTEGGLWVPEGNGGYWIFAGLLDYVLYKVTAQKQVSVFMERAGYTGNGKDDGEPLSIQSTGVTRFSL